LEITSVPNKFGVPDYIHVLSHELRHVAQTRNPNKVSEFLYSYDRFSYKNNPYEIQARVTGDNLKAKYIKKFGSL
jgi:hypothetical protein